MSASAPRSLQPVDVDPLLFALFGAFLSISALGSIDQDYLVVTIEMGNAADADWAAYLLANETCPLYVQWPGNAKSTAMKLRKIERFTRMGNRMTLKAQVAPQPI